MVEGCTDTDEIPKPPWRERKQQYLANFCQKSLEVRHISLADKLHNTRSILADYRRIGKDIWSRQGNRIHFLKIRNKSIEYLHVISIGGVRDIVLKIKLR